MSQLDRIDGLNAVYDVTVSSFGAGRYGNYAMATDFDAGGVIYSEALIGVGVGVGASKSTYDAFQGKFEGLGHAISNLNIIIPYIILPGGFVYSVPAALFGALGAGGSISNVRVANANIVNSTTSTGALVGSNSGGIVQTSSSSGVVNGGSDGGEHGGLVGNILNNGVVQSSSSSASVSGSTDIGGLVGTILLSGGSVINGNSSGTVTGSYDVGGLVGNNNGTISKSFSTGNVVGTGIAGSSFLGGLVGYSSGAITSSYASGSITQGVSYTGGLAGWIGSTASISNSYATGNVTASGDYTGGLVGFSYNSITGSYASGNVTGVNSVGGLVGRNNGPISNSYATGNISSTGQYVGGLVGDFIANGSGHTISNSYSTGVVLSGSSRGGLVGRSDGTVTSSYWDTQTSGQSTSAGGTGLTTAQMQDLSSFQTTYAGFDFQNVWSPPNQTGQGGQVSANYPQLYALTPVVWDVAPTATKTYGSTNPALAPSNSYGGPSIFLFGGSADTLTSSSVFTTSATPASDVGSYAISANNSATSSNGINYRVVTTGSGSLTITPAPITVSATGGTSVYGSSPSNPGFTAVGLQNSQTTAILTGLSNSFGITSASDVGSSPYTLAVSGILSNANYSITARNTAAWSVTAAPITVSATGGTSVYGSSPSNPGFTATGLQNSQTTSVLTGLSN